MKAEEYTVESLIDEANELKDKVSELNLYLDDRQKYIKTLRIRNGRLEEWLTKYKDNLKKENVFHKNTGIINDINKILDKALDF